MFTSTETAPAARQAPRHAALRPMLSQAPRSRHLIARASLAAALTLAIGGVHAEDFFKDGSFGGELRLYQFDRHYDADTQHNTRATSLAGLFTVKSGKVGGFSLAATAFSAQSLGTRASDPTRVDTSLMGPRASVSGFTQAYVEYANDWLVARAGDQYLNTPWMGQFDSRMIPASYQGAMFDFKPAKGWDIYAIRTLRWKSRTSDGYNDDNLYYPSTYHGDSMYGNNGALPATSHEANGTTAIGSTYTKAGLKVQAWFYDFEHFGKMSYVDGLYTFRNDSGITPFLGAQIVRETTGSDNVLVETHTKLTGLSGDRVDAQAWGVDAGATVGKLKFDVAYNKLEREHGAVGGGAIISPYSNSYSADPLYTTSMLRGLVEQGPGHAWKAKATYLMLQDTLSLTAAYAHYDTNLRGTSHNLYVDVVYKMDQWLKGLQIRDRWEHPVGGSNNLNPQNMPWTSNRLMIAYQF